MAVIRDVIPQLELFQPDSADAVSACGQRILVFSSLHGSPRVGEIVGVEYNGGAGAGMLE